MKAVTSSLSLRVPVPPPLGGGRRASEHSGPSGSSRSGTEGSRHPIAPSAHAELLLRMSCVRFRTPGTRAPNAGWEARRRRQAPAGPQPGAGGGPHRAEPIYSGRWVFSPFCRVSAPPSAGPLMSPPAPPSSGAGCCFSRFPNRVRSSVHRREQVQRWARPRGGHSTKTGPAPLCFGRQ